ncbi:MAG: type IV pili methyl-accepting chemotaxis transducer N-terminal domain-containing protein [Janthinobacterium lividum]
MVSVIVTAEPPIAVEAIGADFSAAGFDVLDCAELDCAETGDRFVPLVVRHAPDLVVAVSAAPSDLLLECAALIKKAAPCPFVLFTSDTSPARIERAIAAGMHGYVIDGYAPRRLRNIAQVAISRFVQERSQGERLDDLARDLRDRKQVERAKGLLMRSRGLSEAGAFELMRGLAMHRRLRLASVAEAVVSLSIGADAVNRAGQLRMLAQRLARCVVQLAYQVHAEWAASNLRECRERIEDNIAVLQRTVADRGCAADLERIAQAWAALHRATEQVPGPRDVEGIDALAEALTQEAERLAGFLETSGLVTNLRVINLAGRQRMLSQRVGKLCLLLALDETADTDSLTARATALHRASGEFAAALAELERMPIRTPVIDRWLAEARAQWREMLPFQRGQGAMPRCIEVSESLLQAVEALTAGYEQAAQVLIGDRIETFTAGA